MKNLIMILTLIFVPLTLNAQWYYNEFSVTNIEQLTKPQLDLALKQAEKNIKTGEIITGVGGAITIVGFVMYSTGLNAITTDDYGNITHNVNKAMTGIYVACAGGLMVSVGVPVWIIGNAKKNQIKVSLVKFEPTSMNLNQNGLSIKFKF